MDPSEITRFCIVRHGETLWNVGKRIQGHIDIDLNASGRIQAQAVGSALSGYSFAGAYSSDLLRAWQTAQIASVSLAMEILPLPELRERHFGVLQGITSFEASDRFPDAYHHHRARTKDYASEGGESLIKFQDRILPTLDVLAARHAGKNVLAFTHGGVLDIVYRAATGRSLEAPRDFSLPNAALNWLEYENKSWRLISWADCTHLGRTLDEVLD